MGRRGDWFALETTLREACLEYDLLRAELLENLEPQIRLAAADVFDRQSWSAQTHAEWARTHFSVVLRAQTFMPKKTKNDLPNLRSLAGLVREFALVKVSTPEAVDEWLAGQWLDGGRSPDANFLRALTVQQWQPVVDMLNPDTWSPARSTSLEDVSHRAVHGLFRVNSFANKRAAHHASSAVFTYVEQDPPDQQAVLWHASSFVSLQDLYDVVDLLLEAIGNLDLFFGVPNPLSWSETLDRWEGHVLNGPDSATEPRGLAMRERVTL